MINILSGINATASALNAERIRMEVIGQNIANAETKHDVDGSGVFMVSDAHPGRVIHVDLGQDGTMFDPFTITL